MPKGLMLPDERGGVFTNYVDWKAFVGREFLSPVKRFGPRATWASQAAEDSVAFNKLRIAHHSNFLINTSEIEWVQQHVFAQLSVNYAAWGNRDGICIDAPGALFGKSMLAASIGRSYERELRALDRRRVEPRLGSNPLFMPFVMCTLPDAPQPSRFDEAVINFYGQPIPSRVRVGQLPEIIARLVHECDTSVICIDEIQNLKRWREADRELSDHIKRLQNELPVTFILVGIDCVGSGVFREGTGIGLLATETEGVERQRAAMTQTEGRFRHYVLSGFDIATPQARWEWQQVVLEFEHQLCLLKHEPGSLSADQDALMYLYEMDLGHARLARAADARGRHGRHDQRARRDHDRVAGAAPP